MRIAILGDIHLYDLAFRPWQLVGKRLLGQTNLWLHRKKVFDPSLFAKVLQHAMSLEPDWLVFTGDLTTTALDSEFKMAADVLGPLLERDRVMIVPGNHDRYTFGATWRKRFEAHMGAAAPKAYPHVVDLTTDWRMVGLDSCCPRLVTSRGRVGNRQLVSLEQVVSQTSQGKGLLVVCHYPVKVPADILAGGSHVWSHRLADADKLAGVLEKARGPVVFVHGHIHRPWQWRAMELEKGAGVFRIINAGSPCMITRDFPAGQGFWMLELSGTAASAADAQGSGYTPTLTSLTAHRPTYESTIEPTSSHGRMDQPLQWHASPVNLVD